MITFGNNLAFSFCYTPDKSAGTLHYGNWPLIYLQDEDYNYFEFGYNPVNVDINTRFLLYTGDGFTGILGSGQNFPDLTLISRPSVFGQDGDGISLSGVSSDYILDPLYGSVMNFLASNPYTWYIGRNAKHLWIKNNNSFIIEGFIKPSLSEISDKANIYNFRKAEYGIELDLHNTGWLTFNMYSGVITPISVSGLMINNLWQHFAVIFERNYDAKLYVSYELKDQLNISGINIFTSGIPDYSYAMNKFVGQLDFLKLSIGEFSELDFTYCFYLDYMNSGMIIPKYLEKNKSYSLYTDWNSGKTLQSYYITNTLDSGLNNFSLEFSDISENISFEQIDFSNLDSMVSGVNLYVKVPYLSPNSTIQIYKIIGDSGDIKVRKNFEAVVVPSVTISSGILFYKNSTKNIYIDDEIS